MWDGSKLLDETKDSRCGLAIGSFSMERALKFNDGASELRVF